MTQKKPEAGEFWEWAGKRLRIIGTRHDGRIVGENQAGGLEMSCHIFDMTHLPECDSFDWQPETFPQYFVRDDNEPFSDCDHLVRTAKTKVHGINIDGSSTETVVWSEFHNEHFARGVWKQITQAEAEARIKKPEPELKPEMSSRELEFLEIVAKQRDTIDKLAKRVERLEQAERRDRAAMAAM